LGDFELESLCGLEVDHHFNVDHRLNKPVDLDEIESWLTKTKT
jgi:hypothetical protein